ncbi:MAG: YitT family protein, partial [Clostridia bacterium]|nr:YitT family protein [Clostridia bacterium]
FIYKKIIPFSSTLTDDPLLELVYAVLLTGIGSAIIFSQAGSSGGTDIIALILKKYTSINVGRALLFTDLIFTLSAFLTFGIKTGLFSLLGLFAKAFIVDGIIESIYSCKYFAVITDKPQELKQYIIKELHHGVTSHRVIGEFSGEDKTMLHTVCHRMDAIKLKRKANEVDPHSFIVVTTTSEIIGRGFREV